MRKPLIVLLIGIFALNMVACSAPTKTVNGIVYSDYGLLNQDDKNPNIKYEPNWMNIVIGAVFFEMVIPPIYVFGFHLFKPVGPKTSVSGQIIPN